MQLGTVLGFLFLLAAPALGWRIARYCGLEWEWPALLALSWAAGALILSWGIFLAFLPLHRLPAALGYAAWLGLAAAAACALLLGRRQEGDAGRTRQGGIAAWVLWAAWLFCGWLIGKGLSYDPGRGELLIQSHIWSDFGQIIPLVRSFSWGLNWPLEFPIFPGGGMRYHFLASFFSAVLEHLGLRLDRAVDWPDTLSFLALLMAIYRFGNVLFPRPGARSGVYVGLLSIPLFLFPTHLGIVRYLQHWNFSLPKALSHFWRNDQWWGHGPFNDSWITAAYWDIPTFINQRHFALPLALGLFALAAVVERIDDGRPWPARTALFWAACIALMPSWHFATFVGLWAILLPLALFFPIRREIGLLALVSWPAALFQILAVFPDSPYVSWTWPRWRWGFLCPPPATLMRWTFYWFINLGLGTFWLIHGWLKSDKTRRTIFVAALPLFLLGNTVQFISNPDANHKFFNLWMLVAHPWMAFSVCRLGRRRTKTAAALFLLTTSSGLLNFMVLKNVDHQIRVPAESKAEPLIGWIRGATPGSAVFLTSGHYYHPASMAGRKVFHVGLGAYLPWAIGFDTASREMVIRSIYEARDKALACALLRAHRIDYVAIGPGDEKLKSFRLNAPLFERQFAQSYPALGASAGYRVYEVARSCSGSPVPPRVPDASARSGGDLLRNGGFELGMTSWNIGGWHPSPESFGTDGRNAHAGGYSLKIEHSVPNDSYLIQKVPVEPDTVYRVSGWIKTRNVRSSEGDVGANIASGGQDGYGWFRSMDLQGTRDWSYRELWVRTSRTQKELSVLCRLGYWVSASEGTAWFDQIAVDKPPSIPMNAPVQSFPPPR